MATVLVLVSWSEEGIVTYPPDMSELTDLLAPAQLPQSHRCSGLCHSHSLLYVGREGGREGAIID